MDAPQVVVEPLVVTDQPVTEFGQDHLVVIVVEYHVMAADVAEATKRALDNVNHQADDLFPHSVRIDARPK
jgi:hypothetical protein